jgi:hypothetical protein
MTSSSISAFRLRQKDIRSLHDPLASGVVFRKQVLGAAFTFYVSAWEAYLEAVTTEFLQKTATPTNLPYAHIHSISRELVDQRTSRFNTPNYSNGRNLLSECTGYDPINDWIIPPLNRGQTEQRLNEIVAIRHSFAHGFTLPAYNWLTSTTGRPRLTAKITDDTRIFIGALVRKTDLGLEAILRTTFGRSW